ncbi:MAG: MFS transporter [Pseudomonadota bacterium]
MSERGVRAEFFSTVGKALVPFADAASDDLPLGRLMRLALFQVSVGMATVLLMGTLNRVMIVELRIGAGIVAALAALPVLTAPFRAVLGHRSDHHRSAIGWKRSPYLALGTMWQFGGLAIMPFALLLISGDTTGPMWIGYAGGALAFVMTGVGLHMVQTAGLALATDLAPEETRPRVVALLYVMLLFGMLISAFVFGYLLSDFGKVKLVQVIQGAAALTLVLNLIALWKQEAMRPQTKAERALPVPGFSAAWADFLAGGRAGRLLAAVALGTMGFAMQDILLEPYGGQVLGLSVGATTALTGLWSLGALAGFGAAARWLARGADPCSMMAWAAVAGAFAFAMVIFSAPMESGLLFRLGAASIGFGSGLFAVAGLTAAMSLGQGGAGLALGAWGAATATATGLGVLAGGLIRDFVGGLAEAGALGEALSSPAVGYSAVWHLEIALLFVTLVVIGPLVRKVPLAATQRQASRFGLAEFPT